MANSILVGIKFFSCQEHKETFDQGKLFTRHIGFYRENSESLGARRGDSNEGVLRCSFPSDGILLQTESGEVIKPVGDITVTQQPIDDQHIFSFMILPEEWRVIKGNSVEIRIPQETSEYFFKEYGSYYSPFLVDNLLGALKNKLLPTGMFAYRTHFKVGYFGEEYLRSVERSEKINKLIDQIETAGDDYETANQLFDVFYKAYMGEKSIKNVLENEMRVVLNVFSRDPSVLDLSKKKT